MKRWIIEDICDKIDNWEGNEVYVSDLASYIYQSALADGSILYGTYKTRQWIAKYFEDIADVIYDYSGDFDYCVDIKDAFLSPESFHVGLVKFMAGIYLSEIPWVNEHESEAVCLTEQDIETIKEELLATINE